MNRKPELVHFATSTLEVTGPAFFGHVIHVSPFQGTSMGPQDGESLLVRFFCHRVVDALPAAANLELLRTLAEMYEHYMLSLVPAQLPAALSPPATKCITRVTRSVRPELSFEDIG